MTGESTEMEIRTPSGNDTNAKLGSTDTTSDHHARIEPSLAKILEDLAKSENGKQDAESLREWSKSATGQGLDMRDDGGQTLLHVAAVEGLSEAANKLIHAFPDLLNVQEERQRTPLFEACLNKHSDIVKLLLDNDANTALTDEYEETPLHVAAELGNRAIVELLLNKSKETVNFQSRFSKWTPLHLAASYGHTEIISYLRDNGSLLDRRDGDGWTPLWAAVYYNKADSIRELLQKKIEHEDLQLETGNLQGRTPLMEAAGGGFLEGVRLLVKAGAKCDKSESTDTIKEDTALHLAVSTDQYEIVRFLLDSQANVNARNAKGQHSSHLASLRGNTGILKLLLEHAGSNGLNAQDTIGMTPLHLACNAGKPDDDESGDGEQETSDTTANAPTDDNKSTSEDGRYIGVIKLLLERNADTNAVTKDDRTALELALDSSHVERAEAILNSLEETSPQYSQALRRAASDRKRHALAISLLRRQLNRQLNQPGTTLPNDPNGMSAIEWAAYVKKPDVLWLLIASSVRSEETKADIKRAKDLIESWHPPAKTTTKSKNQKRDGADDMKKRDKVSAKKDLIRDIINNPPTGLSCSDIQEYSIPSSEGKRFLEKYEATIIQFRQQQDRLGSIIKSESVKKTIYAEGPEGIMHGAVSELAEQAQQLAEWTAKPGGLAPISMDPKEPPKFTWVHLPATNMTWMDDLLQRIMRDERKTANEFSQAKSFFKDSWIQVPDKVSPSRIMRPRCVWRNATESGSPSEDTNEKGSAEQKPNDNQKKVGAVADSLAATAIYMPYFSYSFECCYEDQNSSKSENASKRPDSHEETDTRQKEVEEPTSEKTDQMDHPEDDDFARSLHSKRKHYQALLDAYEEKTIHGSSTLDESYYHFGTDDESQKDKTRRNRSQVVTESWDHKRTKEQQLGSYWPLIRVNQLWIWTIDDKWLISASSHPVDDNKNELLDGILDLLEKQKEAGGSGLQPSSTSEMSQFIVDYCVEAYERKPRGTSEARPKHCRLEEFLSIRQTFSQSINSIARDETDLFGNFGDIMKELRATSSLKKPSNDAQDPWQNKKLANATVKAEQLSTAVKDILDELNILKATAHYQQDVQRSMKAMKAMRKQDFQSAMKEMQKDKIPETDLIATYIIKDISRLDSVAKRVHDAVNTTLSRQQSEVANLQAKLSLDQAKLSVEQADASAQQGRVVMIFTVVTILFLPLSFLTSFFALDVSSFQAPGWAVGIIFSISIALSIPTIVLAFTWAQSKRFMADLLEPTIRSYFMFNSYARKFVLDLKKKQAGNERSHSDLEGPGTSCQGAGPIHSSLPGCHDTGDRRGSINHGPQSDVEKGLRGIVGSTQ